MAVLFFAFIDMVIIKKEQQAMLYIMRHGMTKWNEMKKLQGRTDIPLNENGRQMAREVQQECAKIGFDICYTSPLLRAKETAQIAFEGLDVPIIEDKRLEEMCFGVYEGCTNYFEGKGEPINVLFQKPAEYKAVEGGESLEQLYDRTGDFLKNVIEPELEAGKKVLIVGHGAMNCSIISQIRNIPVEKFWEVGIPNCKLIKLV